MNLFYKYCINPKTFER